MRISDWSSDVCSSDLRIESIRAQASSADRMVDAVARANGGRYSVDLHLRHDLQASESYAVSHVRRLEAMRRAGAGPERQADGRSAERSVGKESVRTCRSRGSASP